MQLHVCLPLASWVAMAAASADLLMFAKRHCHAEHFLSVWGLDVPVLSGWRAGGGGEQLSLHAIGVACCVEAEQQVRAALLV